MHDKLKELLNICRAGKRTLVMGILNVTPDSFSDGGTHAGVEEAVAASARMVPR